MITCILNWVKINELNVDICRKLNVWPWWDMMISCDVDDEEEYGLSLKSILFKIKNNVNAKF
jgi:hypothetical protein